MSIRHGLKSGRQLYRSCWIIPVQRNRLSPANHRGFKLSESKGIRTETTFDHKNSKAGGIRGLFRVLDAKKEVCERTAITKKAEIFKKIEGVYNIFTPPAASSGKRRRKPEKFSLQKKPGPPGGLHNFRRRKPEKFSLQKKVYTKKASYVNIHAVMNAATIKLFIIPLFWMLAACSSLDKTCAGINWREMGRQDSARGRSFHQMFEEQQEMCGLDPDSVQAKAYKNGFQAGIREYCSFKSGYIYGFSELDEKSENCPKGLREAFAYGYKLGGYMSKIQLMKADLESKIQSIIQEISKEEARLEGFSQRFKEHGRKSAAGLQKRKAQKAKALNLPKAHTTARQKKLYKGGEDTDPPFSKSSF